MLWWPRADKAAQPDILQRCFSPRHEVERFLTETEAAQIVAGARDTAQAAAGQQQLETATINSGQDNKSSAAGRFEGDSKQANMTVSEQQKAPFAASMRASSAGASESLEFRETDASDSSPSLQSSQREKSEAGVSVGNPIRQAVTAEVVPASLERLSSSSSEPATPSAVGLQAHSSSVNHNRQGEDTQVAGAGEISESAAALLSPEPVGQSAVDKEQSGSGALDSIRGFLSKLAKWVWLGPKDMPLTPQAESWCLLNVKLSTMGLVCTG